MNTHQTNEPIYSSDCYLLLDGLQMDVPVTAFTLDDHPRIEPLFRNTRHANLIEASPWLIKPSAEGKLLSETDTWQKHGVLLRSPAPQEELAAHLRSLISVRLPSQQLAYCRFHAPDWANRLFSSMRPEEFFAWSGPITEWLIYTGGNWHGYQNSLPTSGRQPDEEGWYLLRDEQLEHWQTEEHQRFIEQAAQHLGHTDVQPNYGEHCQHIAQWVKQAQSYGLTMEYQILHFLELTNRFPEEISSPRWKAHFTSLAQDADLRLRLAEQQLFGLTGEI